MTCTRVHGLATLPTPPFDLALCYGLGYPTPNLCHPPFLAVRYMLPSTLTCAPPTPFADVRRDFLRKLQGLQRDGEGGAGAAAEGSGGRPTCEYAGRAATGTNAGTTTGTLRPLLIPLPRPTPAHCVVACQDHPHATAGLTSLLSQDGNIYGLIRIPIRLFT